MKIEKVTIEKVTIETGEVYLDEEDSNRRYVTKPILTLKIPLPGGEAVYTIDLPKGVKESLEFAAQLSERK